MAELSPKHVMNNVILLESMDNVVRFLNDETGLEPWLMCGLPDGWDKDDLIEMAKDEEMMDTACMAFRHAMRYSKAGWFTFPFDDWQSHEREGTVYGASDDGRM